MAKASALPGERGRGRQPTAGTPLLQLLNAVSLVYDFGTTPDLRSQIRDYLNQSLRVLCSSVFQPGNAAHMVEYLKFLPDPPVECRDPELFRMLNEFEFVRWHPDCTSRREELKQELTSESTLHRAEAGTSDPAPQLRFYCGQLLVWVRRNDAAPFTLKLLEDSCDDVRGGIARILGQLRDDRYLEPLVRLARTDASPFVRGCAASGLGGQDPVSAIPVLLELLDNDHEAEETGHTPSDQAATALDEMMETEWTQKRHPDGLRSLNPDGRDISALKEQALVYLDHCRQSQGT